MEERTEGWASIIWWDDGECVERNVSMMPIPKPTLRTRSDGVGRRREAVSDMMVDSHCIMTAFLLDGKGKKVRGVNVSLLISSISFVKIP